MKLLMENWRNFINEEEKSEVSDISPEEQKENTEQIINDENLKKEILDFLKNNPDIVEDILSTEKDQEKIKLREEFEDAAFWIDHYMDNPLPSRTKLETIFEVSPLVLTAAATLGINLNLDNPELWGSMFGAAGVALIANYVVNLAKKAKRDGLVKKIMNYGKMDYLPPLPGDDEDDKKNINEKKLTTSEKKKKEKIVKGMKSSKKDFEKRYPGRGEEVMYATATKQAEKKKKK